MGTVEDGDLPFGGDFFVNAPQEIVVQFLSSGFFEGYYVQPLRIHPGEDMLDAAVLAPCIHSLKNNQNFVLVLGKSFFAVPAVLPSVCRIQSGILPWFRRREICHPENNPLNAVFARRHQVTVHRTRS